VVNFVKFCASDFKSPFKREVIHGIGLVTPTFVITSWMNFDETPEVTE
jgi:hypothetical protein